MTELRSNAVGFPTALATAVGVIIAGSVLLTATTGFGIGGGTFALTVAIAFVLMLTQTASFAEAAGMIPTAASVYDYISRGLGRFPREVKKLMRLPDGRNGATRQAVHGSALCLRTDVTAPWLGIAADSPCLDDRDSFR